jgi:transposase
MLHVGMDWHQRQSDVTVRDANGRKIRSQHVNGSIDAVIKELKKLDEPFTVCFEASTGYGHVFDKLAPIAHSVKVGHPGHLRLIFRSKRKSDRIDSDKLSKLSWLGEIPEVHVPDIDTRAWRGAINYRHSLVCERTATKSRLRALLRSRGVTAPRSMWSKVGRQATRELEFAQRLDALRRDDLLESIERLTDQVKRVEKELDAIARKHPGVALLRTIPGIGARTAEAVVAWIDDPARFSSVRQVAAYFGLVPCMDKSAGQERYGHITREGPSVVRGFVTEAAWQAIRYSPMIRAYFDRIQRGDAGRKHIAIVATAHYLVRVMAAMLKTGEVWRGKAA